jgi:SAM-dependent methyltransferase
LKSRRHCQGLWTIAQLNWPFYFGAIVALGGSRWMARRRPRPATKFACGIVSAASLYFLLGSLAVSYLVYDRSDLYRWRWLRRALRGARRDRMIFCHSGFDETSEALRETLGTTDWIILDHYDEQRMSEPSIRRARRKFPPLAGTISAAHDRWPVAAASVDVVFGLLAIHELRSESERRAWFAEAKRCLRPDGRVVLAEHTRDLANFLAFGPGFLHFHSTASWQRSWEAAGFRSADEFRVTPWIRIFVLALS